MTLSYSQMPLDRCSNQRKDQRWLNNQFNHEHALLCVVKDNDNLFSSNPPTQAIFLSGEQLENISVNSCIFLGKDSKHRYFAIDFNKLSDSCRSQISQHCQWQSLRRFNTEICDQQLSILALAKALVHWHKTHLHCGKCGHLNQLIEAGHARRCTHSNCRNMTFPRTDPAIIVLVERLFSDGIARCLLARQASWPTGMYSTLAGFVDPGESIEDAVRREVAEESGIIVQQVSYVDSQPWPFPSSVMLGFTAIAQTQEIDISQDVLESAQWFSREQLATFVAKESPTDKEHPYRISSADSISHFLISAWKNQQIGHY